MGKVADWLREIKEILDITLFNKWLWIIIGAMSLIAIVPFFIMSTMLMTPPGVGATITILVITCWAVAGGYKDWTLHKHKKEKARVTGQETIPFNYERYSEKENND
jgi:uncharacterized protein involved in cysteine biosynthesis